MLELFTRRHKSIIGMVDIDRLQTMNDNIFNVTVTQQRFNNAIREKLAYVRFFLVSTVEFGSRT